MMTRAMTLRLPFLRRTSRRLSKTKALIYILGLIIGFMALLSIKRCIQKVMKAEFDYKTIHFINRKYLEYPVFDYLPKISCGNNGSTTFLLLCIPSATGNFEQRMAIRNSWGGVAKGDPSLMLVFFVGKSGSKETRIIVEKETQIYRDIVEVDIKESYDNLAKKSIKMLEWTLSHCNRAKYILKVDDDIFLNVKLLKADLKRRNYSNSIVGCKVKNSSPFRFPLSKWYLSRAQYSADTFPEYISGPAYVLTGDILSKLYAATQVMPYIFLEDVFLNGICRVRISANAVGHPGFSCGFRDEGPCGGFFRYKITGHHYFPDEIPRMWDELNDRWFKCPFKHSYFVSKLVYIIKYI